MEIEDIFGISGVQAVVKEKPKEESGFLWEDDKPEAVDDLHEFISISAKYPNVISKMKTGTKTFARSAALVKELLDGCFLLSHEWYVPWVSKVCNLNPAVNDLKFDREELVAKVDEILSYCSTRKPLGFWYPGNGKCNLESFLLSTRRDGKCWSPFIELYCGDCMTPDSYRKALGKECSEVADKILSNVCWPIDFESSKSFFKGVARLKQWWVNNYITLTKQPEARLVYASFSRYLTAILGYQKEFHSIGKNFIGPTTPQWEGLNNYLKKTYNIVWHS